MDGHDPADRLYLLLQGQIAISGGSFFAHHRYRAYRRDLWGSVASLGETPLRHGTAVNQIEVAELPRRDLEDLIRRRPDIGVIIYRNLAVGLGDKLLRSGDRQLDQEGNEAESVPLAQKNVFYIGRDRLSSAVADSP
ncbi:MAG: hypothetical protein HC801_12755 [Nitrospira sp.]|nr:hypothetical protein [Nitrospira sp.]